MDINEILNQADPKAIIGALKRKSISVPSWATLEKEYEQRLHPVITDKGYRDIIKRGNVERMTRLTLGWQKLAVKRMTELIFGIPVKRVYNVESDEDKVVAGILEDIYRKNRINSINIERGRMLYASCEVMTLWYAQETDAEYGGEPSAIKLRCKNFSPMNGDSIYPLFDEYDDLIALSVAYTRKNGDTTTDYFDTYTSDRHIRWQTEGTVTTLAVDEHITLGKISGIYGHRAEPIWEDQSPNVYEAEWTLSRNGNYIRKNARPTFAVYSDNDISFGGEDVGDSIGRNILHYGASDKAEYITWSQAIESIKFHIEQIKQNYFMQLQLPDMSWGEMKSTPMSGESRKMMFMDAQLKVCDEQGLWLEYFDRELNVIRAFAKLMYPQYAKAIDGLSVTHVITPYQINDLDSKVQSLSNATAGKQIVSQRTAVAQLGLVEDVDAEIAIIAEENAGSDIADLFEPEPTE